MSESDSRRLGIYSAVGSPLDTLHGVDAFLEYESRSGKLPCRVTLDATLRGSKEDERDAKADMLIHEVPDPIENEKGYKDEINRIAGQISKILKECVH